MARSLAEFEQGVAELTEGEKRELDRLVAAELKATWLPNPGPQTEALLSEADLLLYGGAAGGGKSDLLLGLALTRHARSVIFRRAYVDLAGVEERLIEILGGREGYLADVALRCGVDADQAVDLHDARRMTPLVEAIVRHENGEQPYGPALLASALALAGLATA